MGMQKFERGEVVMVVMQSVGHVGLAVYRGPQEYSLSGYLSVKSHLVAMDDHIHAIVWVADRCIFKL